MSKFAEVLSAKKLAEKKIFYASNRLEAEAEKQVKEGDALVKKPRASRGVSIGHIEAAKAGKQLTRKVRSKLVRAVNAALTKSGGGKVSVDDLFADVKVKHGPKPEPKKSKA